MIGPRLLPGRAASKWETRAQAREDKRFATLNPNSWSSAQDVLEWQLNRGGKAAHGLGHPEETRLETQATRSALKWAQQRGVKAVFNPAVRTGDDALATSAGAMSGVVHACVVSR